MPADQMVGAADRLGGAAIDPPVAFPKFFASLYHNLGIAPNTTALADFNGRRQYLGEDDAEPIRDFV